MSEMRWKPNVTVAAVIEQQGRFLLVEEKTRDGLMLNNPAGHLEPGESPQQGVMREVLEEACRQFTPQALVGIYMSRTRRRGDSEDTTYLRFAYCGSVSAVLPEAPVDPGIVRTLWLTPDEIRASVARHRSPLILACMDDYLAGRRLPLDAVHIDPSLYARSLQGSAA